MKYYLLFALVAFASAKSAPHLLGDEECTRGPAFWCQDYKSAKQCGSVKYCTEHHWKKQLKGPECAVCKVVVNQLHSVLANNMTETEIIQAIEGVCAMLQSYSDVCKSLVDSYGKELIDMLVEATKSPETICRELGLCSSSGKTEFVTIKKGPVTFGGSKQTKEPKSSSLCIVCEFAMTELDKFLGSETTKEKVVNAVETVCNRLPATVKDECNALIKEYGNEIIDLIVAQLKPKKICTLLRLCSSAKIKKVPKEFVKTPVKDGIECTACKYIVGLADTYLKEKKTQDEIKVLLDEACATFKEYKAECDQYVAEYLPLILQLLAQELSPALVCEELGLCPKTAELKKTAMNKIGSEIGGASCGVCKAVVGYVDSLIKQQTTEAEIVKLAEELCSYLQQYKAECDSLVSAYLPEILKLLAQELSPDLVCKELGLCTSKTELKKTAINKIGSEIGGASCGVCKAVVGYVDSLIKQQTTEAEIVKLAEEFCSYLQQYKAECDSLVSAYLPEILKLLAQELSPDLVCKELGLCTSKTELKKSKLAKEVKSKEFCTVCELVITEVKTLLNNKTEAEVTAAVEKLCVYVGNYKAECQALVADYMPQVIKFLKMEIQPAVVCEMLGLCEKLNKLTTKVQSFKASNSGAGCTVCETLVGFVEAQLKVSKTQQEIGNMLGRLCNLFASFKTECHSLIDAYLPLIIKYITQEYSPAKICQMFEMCPASQKAKLAFVQKSMPLVV